MSNGIKNIYFFPAQCECQTQWKYVIYIILFFSDFLENITKGI